MSIYQKFCTEQFDDSGKLTDIQFHYPDNFNFGYDVVDAIAAADPGKRALVWCNSEGEERIFTFGEITALSNRAANVLRAAGIRRGDHVMVCLKRHFEYWFTAVALQKLGAVLECAVVGIPDPLRGQAIKAYVILNPGYPADRDMEKELRDFANAKMAAYKWIRVIEFLDQIPKTISNKICKAALRR